MTRRPSMSHESRTAVRALLAGLPAVVAVGALWWVGDHSPKLGWTLVLLCVVPWLALSLSLREAVARPLQTLSNLLLALREGDYSHRGVAARGALGEATAEVERVSSMLRERRLEEAEAAALLAKILWEVDVSILAFDEERRLRLVNRAGAQLLRRTLESLLGEGAAALGLAALLEGAPGRTVELTLPGGMQAGSWELRRGPIRLSGAPHQLLLLTDVRRALRQEEQEAWRRLIRVLGHELNNSLAPIQSLAGTLQGLVARSDRPDEWEEDLRSGLCVIERRAASLGRFMSAYTRLAKLPPPVKRPVEVQEWVARVVALEPRLAVRVHAGANVVLSADADQLDQLLINLVKNAADAALECGGGVEVEWGVGEFFELVLRDEGPGLANPANLFVPFFTTKPGGAGIGLALARQIAEAHDGRLSLSSRTDRSGCEARLVLPVGGLQQ